MPTNLAQFLRMKCRPAVVNSGCPSSCLSSGSAFRVSRDSLPHMHEYAQIFSFVIFDVLHLELVDLYNGSLTLYGDGNIDNGVVILFSSGDAKPDDVDNVSLRLECSRSGLTRVTIQVGKYRRYSNLVHTQHGGPYLVRALTFLYTARVFTILSETAWLHLCR